jgi:diphosphomevalonate decarboxylase
MSSILSALANSSLDKVISAKWQAPSNIALVKYWGKIGNQIPANPSLSLTLSRSYSETSLTCSPSESLEVLFVFEGKENTKFAQKIKTFIESISEEWPFLKKIKFEVVSKNTFPHSAGIASSASGMAAFCLCLLDIAYQINSLNIDSLFYIRASHLARLGSGSASRSLFGGLVEWGQDPIDSSFSDTHATALSGIHPEFSHLQNAILIVSDEEKPISSREGHGRMGKHPFAESRYIQAKNHFHDLIKGLKTGDWNIVGPIIESEALSLHAMMLTSVNPYILLRPKTLELIELIKNFREESKLPVYFTIDAGPNLHVIYPESVKTKVQTFLENEARPLALAIIFDEEGHGPKKC